MDSFSVGMALQDFMPVILSSVGLFFLAQMVNQIDKPSGKLAYLGWFMVSSGGFNKAVWKLTMALSNGQTDVRILNDSLFYLMGPGFLCMGFAIWYAQRALQEKKRPWFSNPFIMPGIINGVIVGFSVVMGLAKPDSRMWYIAVLALTTIANFVTAGLVIRQGWKMGSRMIVALFAINVAMIFLLQGMARIPRTEGLEWASQLMNTVSNGAFAVASYMLFKLTLEKASTAFKPSVQEA